VKGRVVGGGRRAGNVGGANVTRNAYSGREERLERKGGGRDDAPPDPKLEMMQRTERESRLYKERQKRKWKRKKRDRLSKE
jgi:hypothetical protein